MLSVTVTRLGSLHWELFCCSGLFGAIFYHKTINVSLSELVSTVVVAVCITETSHQADHLLLPGSLSEMLILKVPSSGRHPEVGWRGHRGEGQVGVGVVVGGDVTVCGDLSRLLLPGQFLHGPRQRVVRPLQPGQVGLGGAEDGTF